MEALATQSITVPQLTEEQRAALYAQFQREERDKKVERENNISSYKLMQDEFLEDLLPGLYSFSLQQADMVTHAHKSMASLVDLKQDLYEVKEDQNSHTFTHRKGLGSVTIGYNTIIRFDGTEAEGVKIIKNYIKKLSADDEKRKILGNLLNTFMKPDKKGNLNPARIAELNNQKQEVNDEEFSRGVDIIVNAQVVVRSSLFVKGWYLIQNHTEPSGKKVSFSMSA